MPDAPELHDGPHATPVPHDLPELHDTPVRHEGPLDTPVLIVGAGPTGLVLAIDLARRGVACRVLDRAAEPFPGSRGKGVMPRTLEVFDDLGVIEQVLDAAMLMAVTRFYDRDRLIAELTFVYGRAGESMPYPDALHAPQWRIETILAERLAALGGVVERGQEFVGLEQDAEAVTATVRDVATDATRTIRAAYLVGADGGRSTVRKSAGLRFEGHGDPGQVGLIGDVEVEGLSREARYVWSNADHTFLQLCPLKGTDVWQYSATLAGDEEPGPATFQRLFDAYTGMTGVRLHSPTWLSRFTVNQRMVDRYRVGRVLVGGDAAHVHSPVSGQGLNSGVQDAYNLGWKLAMVLGGAPDRLLDTYEAERLLVARKVLATSQTGHGALFSTNPLMALLRRWVLLPLLTLPPVTRALLRRLSQIGLHYRESPLSAPGPAGRPRAGDRAPDGTAVQAGTGTRVRLFDLFRGPHFTLLTTEPIRLDGVVTHHLERVYGTAGCALVRPDGYLAYRGPADPRVLRDYLAGLTGSHPAALPTGTGRPRTDTYG
ncbi:FAD-dependent monooxygenase [Sphaerisporangium corydalis]|uniref:FAD-dependent monooxygenase n=1 Tax=Sphaerisporangium corydalis TaxID=1441875 RepID=A0ABV9EKI3_9ACTN|nr:FAD-dependent monooxygenase [Sphaerisporangium corydalis]